MILVEILIFLLFGLTYFDPTTYKNLTDLKPRVDNLYLLFVTDQYDTLKVQNIKLRLAQIYEYERGKGSDNEATAKQINLIRGMFDRHSTSRLNGGRWSNEMLQNNKENIMKLFDTAIETEWLKNRNK